MVQTKQKESGNSRTVSKERRREQLIKSTMRCISRKGIAGTTMADVTSDAGLSLGIINLHFQSKERLFEETLRYLSDEYETHWNDALAKAGDSATEQLAAVVRADFDAKMCERKKLATWFAFWGEVKSRPTYTEICSSSDERNNEIVTRICEQLIIEGEYSNVKARRFAIGLAALINGLWLDLLMTPKEIDRQEAHDICWEYLVSTFPKHFSETPGK